MTEILKDSLEDSRRFADQNNFSLELPGAIVTRVTTASIFIVPFGAGEIAQDLADGVQI